MNKRDWRLKLQKIVRQIEERLTPWVNKVQARLPGAEFFLKKFSKFAAPILFIIGLMLAELVTVIFSVQTYTRPKLNIQPRIITETLPPRLQELQAYNSIIDKNWFCPGCPVPDIKATISSRPKDCNRATNMGSRPKVLGTVVLSNPVYSVAILTDGGESEAKSIGESYKNFGKIFEIRRDRVCFESPSGALTFVAMEDEWIKISSSMTPTAPQQSHGARTEEERILTRQFVNESLNNPDILKQGYAVPERDNQGNIRGFKIMSLNPGSVYEKLGFRAGDTITQINGEPITNYQKILELYSNAANLDALSLTFERGGRQHTIHFQVR